MVLLPRCICCGTRYVAAAMYDWPDNGGAFSYGFEIFNLCAGLQQITQTTIDQSIGRPDVFWPVTIIKPTPPIGRLIGVDFQDSFIFLTHRIEGDYFYLAAMQQSIQFGTVIYRKLRSESFDTLADRKTVEFLPSEIVSRNGVPADEETQQRYGKIVVSTEYDHSLAPRPESTIIATATPTQSEIDSFPHFICANAVNTNLFLYGGQQLEFSTQFAGYSNLVPFPVSAFYADLIETEQYKAQLATNVALISTGFTSVTAELLDTPRNYRFYLRMLGKQIDRDPRLIPPIDEKSGADWDCDDITETEEDHLSEVHYASFDSVAMVLLGGENRTLSRSSRLVMDVRFFFSAGFDYLDFQNGNLNGGGVSSNRHSYTFQFIP